MVIRPASEGYRSVKKGGRQGDVKLENALGRSYGQLRECGAGTCIKAVAMMTPVPKCLTEKNTHDGIRNRPDLFATMGNNAPASVLFHTRSYQMLKLVKSQTKQLYANPTRIHGLHPQVHHLHIEHYVL